MTPVIIVVIVLLVMLSVALLFMRLRDSGGNASNVQTLQSEHPQISSQRARKLNWFVGESGVAQGKTYHIGMRDVTIGRKVGNYIQLAEENVSRTHLKVRGSSIGVEIEDIGSESGTFINGERMVSGVPETLNNGDNIKIGDAVLIYHKEGNFGTNHGLTEQKVAGTMQHKKTATLGAIDWKAEVAESLAATDGDVAQAAQKMGMDEAVFRKMMESAGISES